MALHFRFLLLFSTKLQQFKALDVTYLRVAKDHAISYMHVLCEYEVVNMKIYSLIIQGRSQNILQVGSKVVLIVQGG